MASADALSRLPLQYRRDASVEDSTYHVTTQLHNQPLTAAAIALARETARNPTLSKALMFTQQGWFIDSCTDPNLKPFFHRRHELSVEHNCLMWGFCVVVPPSLQPPMLAGLHRVHPGAACMKTMARTHVWWPGIDNDIERLFREFTHCFKTKKSPTAAPLAPWTWPTIPLSMLRRQSSVAFSNAVTVLCSDRNPDWQFDRNLFPFRNL